MNSPFMLCVLEELKIHLDLAALLASFYCQFDTTQINPKEGPSTGGMLQSDWSVATPVRG